MTRESEHLASEIYLQASGTIALENNSDLTGFDITVRVWECRTGF